VITPRAFIVLGVALSGCLTMLDGLSGGDAVPRATGDGGGGPDRPPGIGPDSAGEPGIGANDGGIADAAACDADLSQDPNHCGRCGHGCLGGQCVASACFPVGILTPTSGQGANEDLEIMDGKVYWANFANGTIYAVPIGGGDPALVASNAGQPTGLFTRNGQMFVTDYQNGLLDVLGGASGGTVNQLASGLGNAGCLAMDSAGNAYTTDYIGGRVLRVGPGGSVSEITTGQSNPWGVTVDDTYIYWTNLGTGDVLRVKLDGSEQTILASNEDLGCLAMDTKYLYWPGGDRGLRRMPKGGGTPVTIGVGKAYLGVALDDVSVYYTDNGRIVRLALPSP
jgi:hypothetical protein